MRLTERQLSDMQARQSAARAFKLNAPTRPESDVLAEVLEALWRHPKVAFVSRYNSGAFTREDPETGKRGFYRFVFTYSAQAIEFLKPYFPRLDRLLKAKLKHPDVLGMLHDGRLFVFECKRQGVKPLPGQQAFLDLVTAHGGIAGVVRSGEEAIALIEAQSRC